MELRGFFRILFLIFSEQRLPFFFVVAAAFQCFGKMRRSFLRHMEPRLRRPAQRLPGRFRRFAAKRFAMRRCGTLFGTAEPDLRPHRDQRRTLFVFARQPDGFLDQTKVIAVRHSDDLPAICLKTQSYIFGKGKLCVAFDRNMVIIIKIYQFA